MTVSKLLELAYGEAYRKWHEVKEDLDNCPEDEELQDFEEEFRCDLEEVLRLKKLTGLKLVEG